LREAIRGYIRSITRLQRAGTKPAAKKRAGRISLTAEEIEELLNRGVNYYVAREFDRAREMFEKVLLAEPDNVEALKSLRRLDEERGR